MFYLKAYRKSQMKDFQEEGLGTDSLTQERTSVFED